MALTKCRFRVFDLRREQPTFRIIAGTSDGIREESPFFIGGGFDAVAAVYQTQPLIEEAFRSGGGVDWGDHAGCLFCAIGAMLRPRYAANIVQNWLPALDGVIAKLQNGAKVADIGCGTGQSTFIMARAFPNSSFVGYDFHAPSIEHATETRAVAERPDDR